MHGAASSSLWSPVKLTACLSSWSGLSVPTGKCVCTCALRPEPSLSGCCSPGPGLCSPAAASALLPPSLSASHSFSGHPAPADTPPSPAPAARPPAAPGLAPWPVIRPPGWPPAARPPAPPPDGDKSPDCVHDDPALLWESGWWAPTGRSGNRGEMEDSGYFDSCCLISYIYWWPERRPVGSWQTKHTNRQNMMDMMVFPITDKLTDVPRCF